MLNNIKSKLLIFLVISFLLGTTVISVAAQTGTKKTLDVWTGTATLTYNGTDMTSQLSPVIINGTTYLPLRAASTLFGKDITYDTNTRVIAVTDKANSNTTYYENQIVQALTISLQHSKRNIRLCRQNTMP